MTILTYLDHNMETLIEEIRVLMEGKKPEETKGLPQGAVDALYRAASTKPFSKEYHEAMRDHHDVMNRHAEDDHDQWFHSGNSTDHHNHIEEYLSPPYGSEDD